ncbi:uncharacterized protein LOC116800202 [Drosophila sechellia]|uniref:uncharacterized protein LOC116800202 n=1 Tax=Drosophila sechellia TaxID=7238 RepID=UPI0013DDF72D|nr:uncharacterized protein LOC116800202 [Drosophila sechellia]
MFCLSGVLVSLLAHLFPRKPKDVVRAESNGQEEQESNGQNKTSVTGYTRKKFKNNLIKMLNALRCYKKAVSF